MPSGVMLAVVDTGPLYAVLDRSDADHRRCLEVLERAELQLVIPALVVAEVAYLAGTRLGAKVESRFVAGLADLDVVAPDSKDWPRIGELVRRYESFPLGTVDASVLVLAEKLKAKVVVTLDRRHFAALRPRHTHSLTLLPE